MNAPQPLGHLATSAKALSYGDHLADIRQAAEDADEAFADHVESTAFRLVADVLSALDKGDGLIDSTYRTPGGDPRPGVEHIAGVVAAALEYEEGMSLLLPLLKLPQAEALRGYIASKWAANEAENVARAAVR